MKQLPTAFKSPFNGDFNESRRRILVPLDINQVEDQPVRLATIQYPECVPETIEAGQTKYYGLAFLLYCFMKYGTGEEKMALCFTVTLPMIVEAMLYYGLPLWNDDGTAHPSIEPFRAAARGVKGITIKLEYEPHH